MIYFDTMYIQTDAGGEMDQEMNDMERSKYPD